MGEATDSAVATEEWGVRVTSTGEVEVGENFPWARENAEAYIAEGLAEGGEDGNGLKPGDETLVSRQHIVTPWVEVTA